MSRWSFKRFLPAIIFSLSSFALLVFITNRIVWLYEDRNFDNRADKVRSLVTEKISSKLQEYLKSPLDVNKENYDFLKKRRI